MYYNQLRILSERAGCYSSKWGARGNRQRGCSAPPALCIAQPATFSLIVFPSQCGFSGCQQMGAICSAVIRCQACGCRVCAEHPRNHGEQKTKSEVQSGDMPFRKTVTHTISRLHRDWSVLFAALQSHSACPRWKLLLSDENRQIGYVCVQVHTIHHYSAGYAAHSSG